LHVEVNIRNTNEILLAIRSGLTRVVRVLPLSSDVENSIRNGKPKMVQDRCEIDWPLVSDFESEWNEP
jgi:hypothetical protein